jgi:SHS2 domain-containing protein
MTTTGHRLLDHTADLALEAWAPDEPALLAEVARAIAAILTDDAPIAAAVERSLSLAADRPDERLVVWINELIFAAVTEGFVVASADVVLRDDGLDARVRGEVGASARIATELKAATYHDLALERGPDCARCRVVIDV